MRRDRTRPRGNCRFPPIGSVAARSDTRPLRNVMKEAPFGGTISCHRRPSLEGGLVHHVARWAGSQSQAPRRLCLISDQGELVDELAAAFDEDGLRRLTERVAAKHAGRVRAVVESMNDPRFVHDTLEAQGWDVLVADAQRVKGLAPLACKTDKIDARVLAERWLARESALEGQTTGR